MSDSFFPRLFGRMFAKKLPPDSKADARNAAVEEILYRKLRESFDCVIRNVVLPQENGYLKKNFIVIQDGVPLVVDIKCWKGMISGSLTGDRFFLEKPDGTRKELNSPVRNLNRFLAEMKQFYDLQDSPLGMVVFADPDCDLDLPPESEGVALVTGAQMISTIRNLFKNAPSPAEPLDPARVLCCARLYSGTGRSFCKGVVTDAAIPCFTESGEPAEINPLYIRFISIDHQPLRLRDKLTVTFINDSSAIFYNHSACFNLLCLDGSVLRVALSRLDTVVL